MANTTNFGWETPDDTDLVKDGAAAIRTLGSAIDTSLVDLKGGTTGQVLAKNSNTDMDFVWSADASGIPATIFDAKGDIIAASAADTAARLAVGSNGQVLQADSTESTGLKWVTPSSGAMTKIVSTSFTGVANQDFLNCFSSTYDSYFIEFSRMYDSGAVVNPTVKINWFYGTNTDIGNGNYHGGTMYITTGGVATTGQTTNGNQAFWSFGRTAGGGLTTGGFLNISSAGSKGGVGNEYNNFNAQGMWTESGGDGGWRNWIGGASANPSNQAITGFRVSLSGGNISGRVTVYGLEK